MFDCSKASSCCRSSCRAVKTTIAAHATHQFPRVTESNPVTEFQFEFKLLNGIFVSNAESIASMPTIQCLKSPSIELHQLYFLDHFQSLVSLSRASNFKSLTTPSGLPRQQLLEMRGLQSSFNFELLLSISLEAGL